MSTFRARTDDQQVIEDVTPEALRPLLTDGSGSVIMDGPAGRTAWADREESGRWRLVVTGASGPTLTATVPNGDAAFDALRSWAADDDWWREAFSWAPESSR